MVSVLAGALVYYNVIDKPKGDELIIYKEGDTCPSLDIPTYNGSGEYTGRFDPSANKGKVTVINFWGVWCPGCIKELPHFDQIASEYPDIVDIVAIHTFDQMDESDEYIEENFPNSDMIFGVDRLVKEGDPTSGEYLYTTLGGTGTYPITIIVDPNGKIFSLIQSELTYDELFVYIMSAYYNA